MAIRSMTGFARTEGTAGGVTWHWEVRSVNGRGLDVRLRLPPGFEALEPAVREAAAKRLSRGSVTVSLGAERTTGGVEIRLNEAALEQVLAAADRIHQLTGCERPRAEGLLALKGVLEVVEPQEEESATRERQAAMLAGLDKALEGLVASRSAEGQRLEAVLLAQLHEMARHLERIERAPARSAEAVKARLEEQIARLLDTSQALDPGRLHQEAVLVATRADVEEELARLKGHIAAARELLAEGDRVGRRLDFLAQEFNREANTLCAKSNDGEITRAGLALKAVIDQMREQVQNIE
jgi:uncharacterized protein (TIGR00255 family)